MKDLIELNRRIAQHALGTALSAEQEQYIEFLPVCVARFIPAPHDIKRVVFGVRPKQENSLPTMYVNRDYLNFARLVCKDANAGQYQSLVNLGLNLEVADTLGELSNDQITRLGLCWPGLVAEFDAQAFHRGTSLHSSAGKFHAAAFLSSGVPATGSLTKGARQ